MPRTNSNNAKYSQRNKNNARKKGRNDSDDSFIGVDVFVVSNIQSSDLGNQEDQQADPLQGTKTHKIIRSCNQRLTGCASLRSKAYSYKGYETQQLRTCNKPNYLHRTNGFNLITYRAQNYLNEYPRFLNNKLKLVACHLQTYGKAIPNPQTHPHFTSQHKRFSYVKVLDYVIIQTRKAKKLKIDSTRREKMEGKVKSEEIREREHY